MAEPLDGRSADLADDSAPRLTELPLRGLRAYRRRLSDEEERVSYWRRLVHARLDVLEAESAREGPLSLEALARVLGDTGTGHNRTALVRVRAAEPLPDLPVLEEMWLTEVDVSDPAQISLAVTKLRSAENQLTSYRKALHQRIDEATAELISRYREEPSLALIALTDSPQAAGLSG